MQCPDELGLERLSIRGQCPGELGLERLSIRGQCPDELGLERLSIRVQCPGELGLERLSIRGQCPDELGLRRLCKEVDIEPFHSLTHSTSNRKEIILDLITIYNAVFTESISMTWGTSGPNLVLLEESEPKYP